MARIVEGLMTGMGFIGGGAILKNTHYVHGTATAATCGPPVRPALPSGSAPTTLH